MQSTLEMYRLPSADSACRIADATGEPTLCRVCTGCGNMEMMQMQALPPRTQYHEGDGHALKAQRAEGAHSRALAGVCRGKSLPWGVSIQKNLQRT